MLYKDRLKKLRIEKGLSQEELSNTLSLNKSTICCYEKGTRVPSLEVLIKLSDYFEVSIDYLLGRDVLVRNKKTRKLEFVSEEEYEKIVNS